MGALWTARPGETVLAPADAPTDPTPSIATPPGQETVECGCKASVRFDDSPLLEAGNSARDVLYSRKRRRDRRNAQKRGRDASNSPRMQSLKKRFGLKVQPL